MILDEIERVVITTLRAAGLSNLKELTPSENQMSDFRFMLQKLEIELGDVGVKQRTIEVVLERINLEQTQRYVLDLLSDLEFFL